MPGEDIEIGRADGREVVTVEGLATGSELHARDDLYGHALLWPNRTSYTVFAPGALRSTSGDMPGPVSEIAMS